MKSKRLIQCAVDTETKNLFNQKVLKNGLKKKYVIEKLIEMYSRDLITL